MQRRVKTWGVVWGFAPLALALACGGKQELQDVGDVGGSAGSGGSEQLGPSPEMGGSGGTTGSGDAGQAGEPSLPEATGGIPAEDRCFEQLRTPTGNRSNDVSIGPHNEAFGDVQREDDPTNYADQVTLSGTTWRINANYPASTAAPDTTLDLPAQLASHAANMGELRVTVPLCESFSVAGRTIRVNVWWKLGGAVVGFPTHGLALGAGNEPTWFEDSSKKFVVGQPESERAMNTLESITLEHTFAEDDETSAADVFLTAWVLADFEFPSILYVGSVEWEPGAP